MNPEKLRLILEDLGPTFIKLGQIASMHPDVLPQAYCEELSKLCSDVAPMPYDEVISIIEESCGCPWNQIFSWIQKTPQGSASIAQVHRARLRSGEQVVVKIQRRGICEIMTRDIYLLQRLLRFLPTGAVKNMVDLDQMLDDIWAATREEMNFVMEAANMQEFSRRNKGIAYIGSPILYEKYTSMHMLVMEYIDGYAVDDREALQENGYDSREIAEKLSENYLWQIIDEGFFHADPHVGNIRIRDGKIIWIDMGMMGRLTENDRRMLTLGLQGIAMNDTGRIEEAVLSLCEYTQKPDHKKLQDDIENILNRYGQIGMGNLKLVDFLADLMDIMRDNRLKMPHSLTMLVRGLTHMEGVLAELSPDINIVEIARTKIVESFWKPANISKELENSGKNILLSLRKGQDIPASLSDALREFRSGEARMKFDLHATDQFSGLLYNLVYGLVGGLLITALLISASIICTTDLQPRFLGMPVIAAVGYGLAILLAVCLIIHYFHGKK
ncbi:MAG: AarF/ABC1/UbiB kinase family protein [Clostridiales bacterium]|nr:AarF/ABC1/UbiB kinase family protein [Clostridiales bacterium]